MTLRNQLLVLISGLFIVLIAVIGWAMLWLSEALLAEFDNQALAISQNVASIVVMADGKKANAKEGIIPEVVEKEVHKMITDANAGNGFSFMVKKDQSLANDQDLSRKTLSFEFKGTDQNEEVKQFQISIDSDPGKRSLAVFGPGFAERIELPSQSVEALLERFSWQLIWLLLLALVVGLLLSALIVYRLTRPLQALAYGAQKIGQGSLGNTVSVKASGEVGQAISAFNSMSINLQQLAQTNQRLQAKAQLSELGEIARGLAHALRNPLNTIGLSLEQLAKEKTLTEVQKDALTMAAKEQINRIDRWIKTLLSLADQGMQISEVDIMAILQDIQLECATKKVRFQIQANTREVLFSGVHAELNMMLHALIINAVEASPVDGEVSVEIHHQHQQLTITVRDQGAGLPEIVRQQLFSPHLTTKTYGAGMGIYLTHRLATNRYQGQLSYQDLKPCGTKACLVLRGRQ